MTDSLGQVLNGLAGIETIVAGQDGTVRADVQREQRKGVPEVIMADRKRPSDVVVAARTFLEAGGRAILSRVPDPIVDLLRSEFPDCQIQAFEASGMVVLKQPGYVTASTGGRLAVLTAGTSDIPVAEEAQVIAQEMGCDVFSAYDVGVAGIHRLAEPLRQIRERQSDVVIVAAGMDGALPSVVCGLVDVPVIGLPTPIGYGVGGGGVAALLTMLQTCAPGLTVVNVGNGIGAGATAALIANRVAAARRGAGAAKARPVRPEVGSPVDARHGQPLVVQKLMYDGSKSYRWIGREVHCDAEHLFLSAVFERDGRDLGYVTFNKGDVFYEYYYFDRWYNVFQVYSAAGVLKGWYCNVTQPAKFAEDELTFVDLALDLWVNPDLSYLVLDEDEFEELKRTSYSADDARAARGALTELIERAEAATIPGRPFVGPLPPPGPTGG